MSTLKWRYREGLLTPHRCVKGSCSPHVERRYPTASWLRCQKGRRWGLSPALRRPARRRMVVWLERTVGSAVEICGMRWARREKRSTEPSTTVRPARLRPRKLLFRWTWLGKRRENTDECSIPSAGLVCLGGGRRHVSRCATFHVINFYSHLCPEARSTTRRSRQLARPGLPQKWLCEGWASDATRLPEWL